MGIKEVAEIPQKKPTMSSIMRTIEKGKKLQIPKTLYSERTIRTLASRIKREDGKHFSVVSLKDDKSVYIERLA